MRKFKKIHLVSISILIVFLFYSLLLFTIWSLFVYKEPEDPKIEIVVSNWDGMQKRYVLCNIETESDPNSSYSFCWTNFKPVSEEEFQAALEENPDFIGQTVYYDLATFSDAKLFYSDNNYFVVYSIGDGYYHLEACHSTYVCGDSFIFAPTPLPMDLDDNTMVNELFDHYTFEEVSEFYNRMDSDYFTIDEKNQKIYVTGYRVRTCELIQNSIIISFEDKTIDRMGENGERIILYRE